jgi:hypothetical protein
MNHVPFRRTISIKHDSEKHTPKRDDTPIPLVIPAKFPLVEGEPGAAAAQWTEEMSGGVDRLSAGRRFQDLHLQAEHSGSRWRQPWSRRQLA